MGGRAGSVEAINNLLGSIIEEIILSSIISQSWKIEIINQPLKRVHRMNGLRLHQPSILNSNPKVQPERKTFPATLPSPVWRCQTYKSSICERFVLHRLTPIDLADGWRRRNIAKKIHHRRHQQANISNSIFKLNIVRFMHTKMRKRKIYSANIHPERELCTFSPKLEYLIINRICLFFFFQFSSHTPILAFRLRTVNKTLFFLSFCCGNKWSFFFCVAPLSEAHISMSCYISIAIYLNRLKKLFIFLCGERESEWVRGDIGKSCDV